MIQLSPDVYVVTKFGIIRSREEFLDALKRRNITYEDYARVSGLLRKAEQTAAQAGTTSAVKSGSRRLPDIRVQGTTAGYGALMNLDLAAGRYFVDGEDASAQPVTVIGWDVKEELFPQQDPIGHSVIGGRACPIASSAFWPSRDEPWARAATPPSSSRSRPGAGSSAPATRSTS